MKLGSVFVTGGGGYVGVNLIPKLLAAGYNVTVFDLFIFGKDVLLEHPNLVKINGDIRDQNLLEKSISGHDFVIHLACISNDPSFELNPKLGKSINYDAFRPLVEISQAHKVKRFIYASSSSVYGLKDEKNVHEDISLEPLTDYSIFKARCEEILQEYSSDSFTTTSLRPATVCGFSRRQRLDVVVNIFTNLAYHRNCITVLGGEQLRPNIHIDDMSDAYLLILKSSPEEVNGECFNVGYENVSLSNLAKMVRQQLGHQVEIIYEDTEDKRSYHITSKKIANTLGFTPKKTILNAIHDLKVAFDRRLLSRPLENENYYNIKRMQNYKLE